MASLSTSCNNAVISPSCYKVVTHNLLTNCWLAGRWQVVGTTCNKSVELNNLVANCPQAGNKQCEHIQLTSCWNSIATSLLQVCSTCAFSRVYMENMCIVGSLSTGSDKKKFHSILRADKPWTRLTPQDKVWRFNLFVILYLTSCCSYVAKLFTRKLGCLREDEGLWVLVLDIKCLLCCRPQFVKNWMILKVTKWRYTRKASNTPGIKILNQLYLYWIGVSFLNCSP
jgi:hypothetical protein